MKHVTDTIAGVIWGLRYFTEDGDAVLFHSTYAKAESKYGLRDKQVVPRKVFMDRFVSGRRYDIVEENDKEVEPGYLPGVSIYEHN